MRLFIRMPPSIEAGPADPKIPTGLARITVLLGMLENSKFALNVAFVVRHENYLHPKSGNLKEVSRGSVHIYTSDTASGFEHCRLRCSVHGIVKSWIAQSFRVKVLFEIGHRRSPRFGINGNVECRWDRVGDILTLRPIDLCAAHARHWLETHAWHVVWVEPEFDQDRAFAGLERGKCGFQFLVVMHFDTLSAK